MDESRAVNALEGVFTAIFLIAIEDLSSLNIIIIYVVWVLGREF